MSVWCRGGECVCVCLNLSWLCHAKVSPYLVLSEQLHSFTYIAIHSVAIHNSNSQLQTELPSNNPPHTTHTHTPHTHTAALSKEDIRVIPVTQSSYMQKNKLKYLLEKIDKLLGLGENTRKKWSVKSKIIMPTSFMYNTCTPLVSMSAPGTQ